ncbi:bifunctional 2-polyprenyl-6-hydroxyphenol methylase/3-demethylubiquinol 3-O-methyltransferase UbiG [Acetobacter fallax]|uniref:Ubiquinone biosynthesis O-methyltransferase n=1 Tax=Acetobacter fallax TaxID=1737473 RepID=A0ABX0K9L4_9PROT|nr:bifunctional 2-polyprenyl-6-hydroxyphenol methylase/3-demethylubiquinol 3-O-methyltransferase UbiG [Acetobacter fallax]NHO31661.1 bifunctional 2-polyprenyl-6-hydroxyphenol methylase/3-demethylubiquinol 3-O-methyltransferase UbiG [Acetobacter fallax]NHO35220.1 bifunctional 2-polyprenyl-6-hydroxyphenol methylase/3-demethylubiquinol 3-O-methyltransferase UbiG [Acetobacter fallax]
MHPNHNPASREDICIDDDAELTGQNAHGDSVSAEEIARFGAIAREWWDPAGPMRPLHAMNPLRIGWIDRHLPLRSRKQARLRVLDLGCGAGLASEALAQAGHDVLGMDAAAEGIAAARRHLEQHPLPSAAGSLTYRVGSAETLVTEGEMFDAVVALEIIEHVTDPVAFMRMLAELVRPGGNVFVSTMNRTVRAFAFAKIGAEYVMRLLPVGTHDWKKFVTPAEMAGYGRQAGLRLDDMAGMTPDLFGNSWRESRDLGVNYIAAFSRS